MDDERQNGKNVFGADYFDDFLHRIREIRISGRRYYQKITDIQDEAHDETMRGKPARDIIIGMGNNGGILPIRAIWELVQNARDVVCDGRNGRNRIIWLLFCR